MKTNWFLTTAAGLGAGLVATAFYSLISSWGDDQLQFLIVGIGMAIGAVVFAVAKIENNATGWLALAITIALLPVAIYLGQICFSLGSLGKAVSHLGDFDPSVEFRIFFRDLLSFVWVLLGLALAYFIGSGKAKEWNNNSSR
ncbi:MAG: hypothetical protein JW722_03050 [Demequinaceae bacterium]|nr:hypothetical protein [Demequinaceae bacterium]